LAKYMGDKLQEGHAKLFFAQAQLMKGRVAQAMNAAVEAEACFAACDDQDGMAGSRSGLSSGLKRAAPSWLAPEGSEGPRPSSRLMTTPATLQAHALVFAAECAAHQGGQATLEKAETMANKAVELARQVSDFQAEERALALLEALYGPAPKDEEEETVQAITMPTEGAGESVAAAPAKSGLDPEWVKQIVESTAKGAVTADDDELHLDAPLMESGMDSLSSVAFRNALNQQIGMNLPAALMFDYPSMRAIIDHVVETSQQ